MRIRLPALILLSLAALPTAAQALDLNGYRAAHGRKALRANAVLAAMAQAHAADLARRGALDHAGFFGLFGGRARASGATAENVSYGCGNQSCAILQWSQSAPHRANMLRADVTSYGLASAVSSSGERYWVLELGSDFAGLSGMSGAAAKKPGALRGRDGIEIREGVEDVRP